ncbi:HemY protein [Arboricoccus pini]|uniref:HemY protein n=1 Tax=Arboricoccus pini TaxID=1963835 RepID=A0A212Q154_9PROT|nr:heme biosynthesis HemY N-terminal domain-containing protein [Arboricoccus pini]SNB53026.1 HemY protein [Arboricoccus pini]
MIRLVVFLIIAILAALVAVWFANNPGHVLLQWQGMQVETSVGVALIGILATAALITLLVEILWGIVRLPARLAKSRRRARTIEGYQTLSQGLIAAAAGDRNVARAHVKKAEQLIGAEPAVLLLGAQSAQLDGDEERARLQFRRMLDVPEASILGLRGLLAQAVKSSDPEALELARRAYRKNPDAQWTVSTLFDLLIRQRLWGEATNLVGPLERLGAVDSALARRHRAALSTLIAQDTLAAGNARQALAEGRKGFKTLPNFAPPSVIAARAAIALDRIPEARRQIERAWQIRPHPELAEVYTALAPSETATERLKRFDRLRRRHPSHLETHLIIGELALAAKDLERARSHLEQAVEQGPTQKTCRLMADLERMAGHPEEGQRWEHRVADAVPDLAWVSEASGESFDTWRPFDGNNAFDRLVWSTPPRLSTLLGPDQPHRLIEASRTTTESEAGARPAA